MSETGPGGGDDLYDEIMDRVRAELALLGAEIETDVRQLISKPVEKRGKTIIRSKRGEPPRMEFDNYRASMYHATYEAAAGPAVFIGPAMQRRGFWLEFIPLDRPHFAPMIHKWTPIACTRIAAAISGR